MYAGGRGGRQLSRTEKVAIVGGIGAAVGGAVGGWKGAAIGGVAGAVITTVMTRGGGQQPQQQPTTSQSPVVQPQAQSGLWGPGAPFSGRPNCMQVLGREVTLQNLTADPLKIFLEGQYQNPVAVIQPRESACADPNLRYEAQVLQTAVSANGWVGGTQHQPRKPEARPGLILVWR
ncbi:MAG: hypothetical protein WD989_00750 [Candidatus Paceibacterota bacterium]